MNEEKKLIDEEIVKALECCTSCHITQCGECPMRKDCFKNDFSGVNLSLVLDLIHRLQGEKKELQESADLFNDFNEKLNGVIAEQKAEIERLTKKAEEATFWENEYLEWATGFLKTRFDIKDWFTNLETQKPPCTYEFFASTLWEKIRPAMEWLDELKERNEALRKENAELQKQVDELKVYLASEKVCSKQAVKDTAKEIGIIAIQLSNMCASVYEFQNRLVDLIEVNYAVEVERKTIIPTNGVEVE